MGQHQPIKTSIRSIHATRGLAAGIVVIAHSLEHGKFGGHVALFSGRFGVEIFFVISGIVIVLAAGPAAFSVRDFLVRRFFRVAPLYWMTTILVAGLAIVLPAIFKTTSFDLAYFLRSLAFVPDIVPGTVSDWRPIFKLGWTLNYEAFFYVCVAALGWCSSYRQRNGLLLAGMAALIVLSLFIERRSGMLAFYANFNLIPFAAGVAIAGIIQSRPHWIAGLHHARLPLSAAAVLAVLAAMSFEFRQFRDFGGHAVMSLAALMVALSALSWERYFRDHGRVWDWLGNISYSLYLLHMFVVGFIWAVLHRVGLAGAPFGPVIAVVVTVVVSCVAATLSMRLFEMPLNALGRRLTTRSAPAQRGDPAEPAQAPAG